MSEGKTRGRMDRGPDTAAAAAAPPAAAAASQDGVGSADSHLHTQVLDSLTLMGCFKNDA